jgi:hypothetical protein
VQQEILEFANKALYFVQPRGEKFWNCEQKHCILFSRAAKYFGVANKGSTGKMWNLSTKQLESTVCCSAAQRKFLGNQQKQLKLTASSEIFWNCETRALYFIRACSENPTYLYFVLPRNENFGNSVQRKFWN